MTKLYICSICVAIRGRVCMNFGLWSNVNCLYCAQTCIKQTSSLFGVLPHINLKGGRHRHLKCQNGHFYCQNLHHVHGKSFSSSLPTVAVQNSCQKTISIFSAQECLLNTGEATVRTFSSTVFHSQFTNLTNILSLRTISMHMLLSTN